MKNTEKVEKKKENWKNIKSITVDIMTECMNIDDRIGGIYEI